MRDYNKLCIYINAEYHTLQACWLVLYLTYCFAARRYQRNITVRNFGQVVSWSRGPKARRTAQIVLLLFLLLMSGIWLWSPVFGSALTGRHRYSNAPTARGGSSTVYVWLVKWVSVESLLIRASEETALLCRKLLK